MVTVAFAGETGEYDVESDIVDVCSMCIWD